MTGEPSILLVEDDPGARRLFEEAIDESEISDLMTASNGREALTVLPGRDGERRPLPDVIVLDLDLPDIHGLDILREFKAPNSPARRIPVIVLSAVTDQSVIDEAYELGANAFLSKPDDYADLLALVRAINWFWLTRVDLPSGTMVSDGQ